MKTYEIIIKYTAYHNTQVEAESEDEAVEIACEEATQNKPNGEWETQTVVELT